MGKRNVASGNDRVAVQAGQILGRGGKARDAETVDDQELGRSTNTITGNAKVGRQADVITGDIRIGW